MSSFQERAIIERFGSCANKPEILKACSDILQAFDFDVEELYINWETFVFSKGKNASVAEDVTEGDSTSGNVKLSVGSLAELQQYILKNLEKKTKSNASGVLSSAKKTRRITSSPMGSMFDMLPSTPMSASKRKLALGGSNTLERSRKTPKTLLSPSPIKHEYDVSDMSMDMSSPTKRGSAPGNDSQLMDATALLSSSGEVLTTLNAEVSNQGGLDVASEDNKANNNNVLLSANFDPAKYKFRIMRQKLLEAADVLDDQIDSLTAYLAGTLPDFEQPGNPNIVSHEDIIAVGRITPDSALASYDESLNRESICLEPSRSSGIGQRVRLNLSKLEDVSFFPGQIVALKGRNANGKQFTVNEVILIPLLGSPTSTADELADYNASLNGSPSLKIVVTSGPYTTNDSLDYAHLSTLVDLINRDAKPPHYVIMFGPFIDYTHPKVVDGAIEDVMEVNHANSNSINGKPRTLDDVFRLVVAPILKRINPHVQVILVPSTRDVSSKHPSYPQDAFDRRLLALGKNFKCFPNPASFQINECLFGCSNNDIFKDLKDVTAGVPATLNRFDRVTGYVLEQRRYYPLFPGGINHQKVKLITPPVESIDFKISEVEQAQQQQSKNVNSVNNFEIQQVGGSDLDVPYLGLAEFTEATPDILIIPSQLKFFARVVKNVVVINPGNFMKPKKAGSYAVLNIEASRIDEGSANVTKVDGEEDLYVHDVWKRCRVDIVNS